MPKMIQSVIGMALITCMVGLLSAVTHASSTQRGQVSPIFYPEDVVRVARRLQKRIQKEFYMHVPLKNLVQTVSMRREHMRKNLLVHFDADRIDPLSFPLEWNVNFSRYPTWLKFSFNKGKPVFVLDPTALRMSLLDAQPEELPSSQAAFIKTTSADTGVIRGVVVGNPRGGYAFNVIVAAQIISHALESAESSVRIPASHEPGIIYVQTENGIEELHHLSTGKSNFAGSPAGRKSNVRKAVQQQLNGIVIPQGGAFSFNDTLIGSSGWEDALVIKNGKDLVAEPGGGICQATTTAFRAAVLAGLPITQRRNHSLYVAYYKEFGVGIDATVYPGKQDFVFENDTSDIIVMLGRIDGDDAFIELYGKPDGRRVELEGPFFAASEQSPLDKDLLINEIGWNNAVHYADGRVRNDDIISRYTAIPKKLHEEYVMVPGIKKLLGMENPLHITFAYAAKD